MKDAQESQASGTSRKRKRITKHEPPLLLPSIEVQRTFGALGDINCTRLLKLIVNRSIANIIPLNPSSFIFRNSPRTNNSSST